MTDLKNDLASIQEKISSYKYADDEYDYDKSWLKAEPQAALLQEFLNGIKEQRSRDDFLNLIEKHLKTYQDGKVKADDIYWLISRSLKDHSLTDGSIIKAVRGRAGGLYLLQPSSTTQVTVNEKTLKEVSDSDKQQEKSAKKERDLEKNFYPSVQAWAKSNGYPNCEITGGKLPGFKWENPDLIEIQYTVGEFTCAIDFGITCFEVKLDVVPFAIWQAAHYKRFSREVYVAFAKNEAEVRDKDEGRVFELAVELGIGVLAIDENREFKLIHSPTQLSPNSREIDLVIGRFGGLFKNILDGAGADLRRRLGIPKISY